MRSTRSGAAPAKNDALPVIDCVFGSSVSKLEIFLDVVEIASDGRAGQPSMPVGGWLLKTDLYVGRGKAGPLQDEFANSVIEISDHALSLAAGNLLFLTPISLSRRNPSVNASTSLTNRPIFWYSRRSAQRRRWEIKTAVPSSAARNAA